MAKENILEDIETKLDDLEQIVNSLENEVVALEKANQEKKQYLNDLIKKYNELEQEKEE